MRTVLKYAALTILALIALALLIMPVAAFAAPKDVQHATHQIEAHSVAQTGGSCSATAIAPHALLTASHCEVATDLVTIDGSMKAHVVEVIRDGHDHTIYLFDDVVFTAYAKLNTAAELNPADRVYMFGNPNGWTNLYTEGYVSGTMQDKNLTQTVFDMEAYFGDSGGALFNKHDEIVAVLSQLLLPDTQQGAHVQFGLSFPFDFKPNDLKYALSYGVKK